MCPTHQPADAAVDRNQPLVTAMAISPSGAFLAVGTANGAMLVFDLRNEAGDPWFAVFGDGDSYKERNTSLPTWLIGRKPPPATPIKALTWSVDSFQLASLDAASTLRVWWMRPEYGQVVEDSRGRQPVVPELAISIGPFMVALSGKMPVVDEMAEQSASAAAAAALTQTGGKTLSEVDILHNQQQGLNRDQGRVELGKWGRSVPLAFHPAFNIVGCQPNAALSRPSVPFAFCVVDSVLYPWD
ncbi:hypothetical protein DUNSADRAFT_6652 [Dunaliella salina]|uniref:Uncharacterized protein n=1 Tax=Dunaliella salina TaxID=3046 RepID=A0ABQ7GMW6_DUNSA|nr:hypothetical protein DUNSADRAFT_6652 [Dunaliella salina]|eukprot:KAF5835941.1 hypothetical protein DUNSADRAFT_6652 [Dunaliella salina]